MSTTKNTVTVQDLQRAVAHSDGYPALRCSRTASDAVVDIALKAVGLSSLHRALTIDLGNGFSISLTTQLTSHADQEFAKRALVGASGR